MNIDETKKLLEDDRESMDKILRKIAIFYPFGTEGLSENHLATYNKWQKELSDVIERIDNGQKKVATIEK